MADLTTTVGSLGLRTPIIAASGTFGYGVEHDRLVDWSLVGAVAVRGLSLDPTGGAPRPRMIETPAGILSAVGRQNVGVEAFARDQLPALRRTGTLVIANCSGRSPGEYQDVVACLDGVAGVDVIELDLSSVPKQERGTAPRCADPEITFSIVANARRRTTKPLWAKLALNGTDIVEIARAAVNGGADAISLLSALHGLAVDLRTRRPALSNVSGRLSGPAIKPVALWHVYELCCRDDVPIVGGGGVFSGHDALEFLMVGACAVQVGTASLYDPSAPSRIARETAQTLDSLGIDSVSEVIGSLECEALSP